MMSRLVQRMLLVVLGLSLGVPVSAQSESPGRCMVTATQNSVNIRKFPAIQEYNVVGILPVGQSLPVIGRDSNNAWYAVQFENEQEQMAWVIQHMVAPEGDCENLNILPVSDQPAEVRQLMSVPVLPESLDDNLKAVFMRGQSLGNDPHIFTKAGDCNTDTSYFLTAFDHQNYDLGRYIKLQPSIDFFAGSFEHISLAGQVGFNTLFMLDPLWANPSYCNADEGPLACEYRLTHPSIALMMFGPNDMINLTEEQFRDGVTQLVEYSLDSGVIPVLTTFTWHQDKMWQKALRFNVITVEIAEEYGLPLINFWRAAQSLPNYGLIEGYTHLTDGNHAGNPYYITFQGEEALSGHTLRNLLTLQMLDMLRREILEP